jgi:hypothetical protein
MRPTLAEGVHERWVTARAFEGVDVRRLLMKSLFLTMVFLILTGAATAGPVSGKGNLRVADAAADACFASCASQAESCKRTCPTTFSAPCMSACDSQAQTCRQGCQK